MTKLYIPPLDPLISALTTPMEGHLPQISLRKVIEERVARGSSRKLLEAIFDVRFSSSASLVDTKKNLLKKWLVRETGEALKAHYYLEGGLGQYTMSLGGKASWSCVGRSFEENKQWVEAFLHLVGKIGNE